MKNKIGRKTLIISVVVIVAFSMVGLAAVNNFLSNQATVTTKVTPNTMEIKLKKPGWTTWQEDIGFNGVKGGETITFHLSEYNPADIPVDGYLNIILTCDEGFGWDGQNNNELLDFESIKMGVGSIGDFDFIEENAYVKTAWNQVRFIAPKSTYAPNFYETSRVDVTFVTGAYGNYTLTAEVVPNTLEGEVESAIDYEYDPVYTYVGDITYNPDTLTFTGNYESSEVNEAMNDTARYLGALYRQADSTIITIEFKGTEYIWNVAEPLKGSNWIDEDGTTLVSAIVDHASGSTWFDLTVSNGANDLEINLYLNI